MSNDLEIHNLSRGQWDFSKTKSFYEDSELREIVNLCLGHLKPHGKLYSDFFMASIRFKCGIIGRFGPLEPELAKLLKESHIESSQTEQIGFERISLRSSRIRAVLDLLKWDALAQQMNKSVAELSAVGDPLYETTCYVSLITTDIDSPNVPHVAKIAKGQGFWGQKWSLPDGPDQGENGLTRNLRRVAKIRNAVGDGIRLMFEAHGKWSPKYYQKFSQAAANYGITWLEDPISYATPNKYSRINNPIVPICVGESFSEASSYEPFLNAEGNEYFLQADIVSCGGYTNACELRERCTATNRPLILHGRRLIPSFHLSAYGPKDSQIILEYNPLFEPERQTLMGVKDKIVPNQGTLNFHQLKWSGLWEI